MKCMNKLSYQCQYMLFLIIQIKGNMRNCYTVSNK